MREAPERLREGKSLKEINSSLPFLTLYLINYKTQCWTVPFLSSALVQHRWSQPSRHLDRHWNPLQGVGHSGQRHLVRQEGDAIIFRFFSFLSLQPQTMNLLHGMLCHFTFSVIRL